MRIPPERLQRRGVEQNVPQRVDNERLRLRRVLEHRLQRAFAVRLRQGRDQLRHCEEARLPDEPLPLPAVAQGPELPFGPAFSGESMYDLGSPESDALTWKFAHPPGLTHRQCSRDPGSVEQRWGPSTRTLLVKRHARQGTPSAVDEGYENLYRLGNGNGNPRGHTQPHRTRTREEARDQLRISIQPPEKKVPSSPHLSPQREQHFRVNPVLLVGPTETRAFAANRMGGPIGLNAALDATGVIRALIDTHRRDTTEN